uniref:Uncharacterized protein n=1 Tax=Arundo donax TaxID=35708 RepID=A0A0A9HJ29_ARUDO
MTILAELGKQWFVLKVKHFFLMDIILLSCFCSLSCAR